MHESILFRPATEADAEGVADVYLTSHQNFLPYAPLAHSDADVRRWVRWTLIPAGHVTVATRDDTVVGMMALAEKDGIGWINQLYLQPDMVGQGIGSRLLDQAKEALDAPIRLYAFQKNHGARRFYERHGFRAIEMGDGSGNEEGCPDVLYEWQG